jgi:L-amino acid N-acyltransferase
MQRDIKKTRPGSTRAGDQQMTSHHSIVAADEEHLPGILAIYNHEVEHSTAIWNDVLVDLENRREWWRGRSAAGFPILAAVAGGDVLGYASYGQFRPFDGYRQTVEHSVYVAENARGRGVGTALLAALEAEARRAQMHVMLGGIAAENEPSIRLHRKLGFMETGRLPGVGRKFGRCLDLVFMQKRL